MGCAATRFRDVWRLGEKRAAAKTDDQARGELGGHEHVADAFTLDDTGTDFWEQTPVLAHIQRFARSRGASPYATLAAVLRRAAGAIAPHAVLPATIGGRASLNLFTCTVGASGHGKDVANAAGRDAVTFHRTVGGVTDKVDDATHVHPGTGEGLARIFAGRGQALWRDPRPPAGERRRDP